MTAPRTADILWQEAQSLAARYARRIGENDAADLAHQAVVNTLARPSTGERPGAYLEVVGRNLLADRWRHERCARAAVDELRRQEPESRDPEREVIDAERRVLVRRAIREIPPELRRPLLLRYFGDLSYSDLAERLGIEEVTARTRVHRSLARLRSSLASRLRALLVPLGCFKPAAVALVLVAHAALVTGQPAAPAPAPIAEAAVARARAPRLHFAIDISVPAVAAARPLRHARPVAPAVPPAPESAEAAPEPVLEPPMVQQPDLTWVVGLGIRSGTPDPPVTIRARRVALAAPDLSPALVKTVDDL